MTEGEEISSAAPRPAGETGGRFALALVLPVATGLILRLLHLHRQILGGDELHAVRASLQMPVGEILTTYWTTDFCQPLSAFYRLWMDAGGKLSELVLRAPILLAGTLLIALAPLLVRSRLGDRAALIFAWALALSPGLVLYSRIVRSYLPATLLATAALLAFFRWWEHHPAQHRTGVAYALLAALAMYFHLGTAPLVAAPFAFAAGDLARRLATRRPVAHRLRSTLLLGLGSLAAVAAFVVPAWKSLRALATTKGGAGGAPGQEALVAVFHLQAGSRYTAVAILFWGVVLLGGWRLWRAHRAFALYAATLVAGHVSGLLLLAPMGLAQPLIFNRYLLFVTPLFLLALAVGIDRASTILRSGGEPWRLAAGIAALLLVAALGPLPEMARRPLSFLHHNAYLSFESARPRLPEDSVPAFYRQIAKSPDSASDIHDSAPKDGALVEAPWPTSWRWGHLFPLYQETHQRDVLAATGARMLFTERTNFRWLVLQNLEAILVSGARYLVVHRQLLAEESQALREAGLPVARPGHRSQSLARLELSGQRLADTARQTWGPPLYRDEWISAWDLDDVRRDRQEPTASTPPRAP